MDCSFVGSFSDPLWRIAHSIAFFDAGYSDVQALEVILGLAVKTMSNYTNSVAGTPLDKAVQKLAWRKPKIAMRDNA